MQGETEGAMKISAKELRKEPTHDVAHRQPQKPFMGSLWIGSGLGWPERDFGAIVQLCHVGARFEALDALIFIITSVFLCIFLRP